MEFLDQSLVQLRIFGGRCICGGFSSSSKTRRKRILGNFGREICLKLFNGKMLFG